MKHLVTLQACPSLQAHMKHLKEGCTDRIIGTSEAYNAERFISEKRLYGKQLCITYIKLRGSGAVVVMKRL